MAHPKYHVDAVVLSSMPLKEADILVRLITREFGCVSAVAKSARQEKSKMRYGLQPLSRTHVSLVRGKDVWRVVGASRVSLPRSGATQIALARICALVTRLVPEEDIHEELFSIIDRFWQYLIEEKNDMYLEAAEILTVARVLRALGYLSEATYAHGEALSEDDYSNEVLKNIASQKIHLLSAINEALRETNL